MLNPLFVSWAMLYIVAPIVSGHVIAYWFNRLGL